MERSKRRSLLEEELLHRQALSMAIQQHQLSQRFEGSMSRRIGSTTSRRRTDLSESSLPNSKQVSFPKPFSFIHLLVLILMFQYLGSIDMYIVRLGQFFGSIFMSLMGQWNSEKLAFFIFVSFSCFLFMYFVEFVVEMMILFLEF